MNKPCFIIAEAGVNHNGSVELAKRLIDIAASAKADAVKFQTFRAENLVTTTAPRASYQKENMGGNHTQFEMLKQLELSFDDFRELKKYCDQKNIVFLSTPFDDECARFLIKELEMPLVKVSSGDATNFPFLRNLTDYKKPLIISTGMCDQKEVELIVKEVRRTDTNYPLMLLHCTSNYPCSFEEVNLKAIQTMRENFHLDIGYSDHTMGIEVAIAATTLGASIIEKHFTLDRNLPGPDHRASLLPEELKNMVLCIRNTEASMGDGIKKPPPAELITRDLVRKSLVLRETLAAGSLLEAKHLFSKRPGTGIAPHEIDGLIGCKLKKNKAAGDLLFWDDLEKL